MGWIFFNQQHRVNAIAQGVNVAVGILAVVDYITNPEANTAIYGASLLLNLATGVALSGEYGLGQFASMVGNVAYAGLVFGQAVSNCNDVSGSTLLMEGVAMGTNLAATFYSAGTHHAKNASQQEASPSSSIAQPS
ncbi:hypothetical protein [Legionella taurinensis]|uniref:Uncharacterized protein n=1 Tax=Legionella taurinensis TaxID=70611 RepID=A0A3A5L8Q5_9GAMM|nr:hypothetical protein [Legionella taurinensis]RJT47974.1 hypothetical protein D6J04_05235 [Legionella taurinensis]RJT68188.1 hypothetical protein D6J03_05360 [Legionella taurinensis]STY25633.1 Uncharacterised protein [Legionella taurinensis]